MLSVVGQVLCRLAISCQSMLCSIDQVVFVSLSIFNYVTGGRSRLSYLSSVRFLFKLSVYQFLCLLHLKLPRVKLQVGCATRIGEFLLILTTVNKFLDKPYAM